MFEIDNLPSVDENFLLIEREYKILHFDEEPILFTGLTSFAYRVLVSLVGEDQDANGDWFARYFYSILSPNQYAEFLSRKITYLDILKQSSSFFVLDKHYKSSAYFAFKTSLQAIPSNYLPTTESYCPNSNSQFSLKYLVSMKGKLADDFYAVPSDLSGIQESFSKLLTNTAAVVAGFGQEFHVYQSAYVPSSFQMRFDVVPMKATSLFTNDEKITALYNKIINYCIDVLPVEVESVFDKGEEPVLSKAYNELKTDIIALYQTSYLPVPENLDDSMKASFHKALYNLEGITKNLGHNYDELNIFNRAASGENLSLGELDLADRDVIETSVLVLESIEKETIFDEDFRDYKIHIYSLNASSRRGKATIRDDSPKVSNPRIKINGKETIENTKFTASLHLDEFIDVKAKGIWINGRCVSLEIDF